MRSVFVFLFALFLLSFKSEAQSISFEWANPYGSPVYESSRAIAVNDQGESFIAGYFANIVDFDPGPGSVILTSAGMGDIGLVKYDPNGLLLWVKQFGGISADICRALLADHAGNIFMAGSFSGIVDFDPGTGVQQLVTAGATDGFIGKYDASGNLIWIRQIAGLGTQDVLSFDTTSAGELILTGVCYGLTDFDPGTGVHNLGTNGNNAFVLKLDPNGNFMWANVFTGNTYVSCNSVTVDTHDNVLVAGHYGGFLDADPGPGTYILNGTVQFDAFVCKLNAAGNFIHAERFGNTTTNNIIADVETDSADNIYLAGSFGGTNDFDPGPGTANLVAVGVTDCFICVLDSVGNYSWSKGWGGTGIDACYAMDISPQGSVFAGGVFRNTVDFDPGSNVYNLTSVGFDDAYVLKLDASGNFQRAVRFGGSANEVIMALDVSHSPDIFTTGNFGNTVDFNPNAGTYNLTASGSDDAFVQKLSQCSSTVNDSVMISGHVLSAVQAGASYQWLNCNAGYQPVANASAQSYIPGIAGNFAVEITSSGCVDTSACIIISGEKEITGQQWRLFPNPGNGALILESALTDPAYTIEVYNASGVLIKRVAGIHEKRMLLDVSGAPGIYLVRITTASGKQHLFPYVKIEG